MSAPLQAPAPTPVWHLYRTLVGVGIVCGLLIVAVDEFTRPLIQANKVAARRQAVLQVLPGAVAARTFRWQDGGYRPVADDSDGDGLAFAGYDAGQQLVGVAVEARGNGYQDEVRVLYGYAFAQQAVVGLRVLESRETPGLGDRAETDPGYQQNFQALDVGLAAGGQALQHPIEFVKQGHKQHAWQIDGITGATVTSKAIATMLAASAAAVVPQLHAHRADFAAAGGAPGDDGGGR